MKALDFQEVTIPATAAVTYQEAKVGPYRVRIYPDECPDSPRNWDNAGTMVYWHRDYVLGDVDGAKEYGTPQDFLEAIGADIFIPGMIGSSVIILPLALLDHSGLHMWIGSGAHICDSGGWDSGQVGYIYMTMETARLEWEGTEEEIRAQAVACMEQEVKTFDQYLRGDVYSIMVVRIEEDGGEEEHIDSCCGFFGWGYAQEEALRMLPEDAKE